MKKTLPMLPLRGKYIFPNTVIHFDVSRSRSVKAIEEAMEHDRRQKTQELKIYIV